jgi:single-stranded-DNA-specific exonuclease
MVPLELIGEYRAKFAKAFAAFDPAQPVLLVSHNDADGLAAAALFARALARVARPVRTRILGRGENPWSDTVRAELGSIPAGGLIVSDLGVRAGPIRAGLPTVIVDHHVPLGTPGEATVISGFGTEPTPTSSLLTFWCATALTSIDDLLWIAAIGIIGDLGEKAGFPELFEVRKRTTATALRQAVSLLNVARRSGSGDAAPALALLMKADGPKDIVSGAHAETALLEAAREEVRAALDAGKRVPPAIRGPVALIRLDSPCQIHPLVAQTWRGRLKDKIVIAANSGYRPGWVHFSARSATGRNLIAFLQENAPANADENYGSGHEQATGGALRPEDWIAFLDKLGFDAREEAAA